MGRILARPKSTVRRLVRLLLLTTLDSGSHDVPSYNAVNDRIRNQDEPRERFRCWHVVISFFWAYVSENLHDSSPSLCTCRLSVDYGTVDYYDQRVSVALCTGSCKRE